MSTSRPAAPALWLLLALVCLLSGRGAIGKPRPAVHVLEIPLDGKHVDHRDVHGFGHEHSYSLESYLPYLVSQSPYAVNDPNEADFIIAHVEQYYAGQDSVAPYLKAVKELPGDLWARRMQDFIWIITNDQGYCEWDSNFYRELNKSIIFEHFGRVFGDYPAGLHHYECPLLDQWPTDCDIFFKLSDKLKHGELNLPCYVQGKDFVVPSCVNENFSDRTRYLNAELAAINRTMLVYFAGDGTNNTHMHDPKRPWLDAGYSTGVRQTFYRLFHRRHDFLVRMRATANYTEEMHTAYFCMATTGWGWSGRFVTSISRGCIPIIMQDGNKVEWEDQLPIRDFALRVPIMYMHKLPELLHHLMRQPGRVDQMLKNLECVWPLYVWSRPWGRALEMTMCALLARHTHGHIQIDWATCSISCGDGRMRPIKDVHFV